MTIDKKGSAAKGRKKPATVVGKNVSDDVAAKSSTSSALSVTGATASSASAVESIEKSSSVTSTTTRKVSQEARKVAESESRSSVVEVTSGSREYIMDSKGNVVRVIEHPPATSVQSSATSRAGKSSEDFITGEVTQSIVKGKKNAQREKRNMTGSDIGQSGKKITQGKVSNARESSDESAIRRQSQRVSGHSDIREDVATSSETSIVESTKSSSSSSSCQTHRDESTSITATDESLKLPNVRTSGTSSESKYSSTTSTRGVDKEGKLSIDARRVEESAKRLEVDGKVSATSSRNVETESTVEPSSTTGHVTFADSKEEQSGISINRSREVKSSDDVARTSSRLGDSSWDGTFVQERPETPHRVGRSGKSDNAIVSNQRANLLSSEEVSSSSISEEISRETSSFEESSGSTSTVVRNVTSCHVEENSGGDDVTRTTDFPSDRVTSSRPINRPGESAWDGSFVKVTETGDKTSRITGKTNDKTKLRTNESNVARTSVGRKDHAQRSRESIEISEVTEEQEANINDSLRSSYIVEYKDSENSTGKRTERITSVSDVIIEENVPSSPRGSSTPKRSVSPEKSSRPEASPRGYKFGQSSWDGSFVYEKPPQTPAQKPDRRHRGDSPRNFVTDRKTDRRVDIRDVTEDNSINEADVVTTCYVVEESASQQSVTDMVDSALLSSITRETIVSPDSPEKIPRDNRSTKPGSSAWDGTFKYEENTRDVARKKTAEPRDTRRPQYPTGNPSSVDTTTTTTTTTGRRNVSDSSIDIRDVLEETSEIVSESIIVEQSMIHESYKDSTNLDLSTTSVETVIIRDGTPDKPAKKFTDSSNVTTTVCHEISDIAKPDRHVQASPDTRRKHPSEAARSSSPQYPEKTVRPLKPGSSTWDGSFVYEKQADKKFPKPEDDASKPPEDVEKYPRGPHDTVDHAASSSTRDVSNTVTSSTEFTNVVEETWTNLDVKNSDVSNVSTTISRDVSDNKKHEKINDLGPSRGPKDTDRTRPESPTDRSARPTKPGSSTWDGSFVYEKPTDKKPGDDKTKPADGKGRPRDVDKRPTSGITHEVVDSTSSRVIDARENREKSPRDVPKHPRGPRDVIDYTTSSSVHDISNTVTSSTEFTNVVEKARTSDVKNSDISNVSTTILRAVSDHREPENITGRSPSRGPQVTDRTRPESPTDRSARPTKPGSSTWDGSFVYEKPTDEKHQKPAGNDKTKPVDGKARPVPADVEKSPRTAPKHPRGPRDIVDYTTSSSVHDISNTVTSSTEFINVEKTLTSDVKTSDISNLSTTISRDISERKKPEKITEPDSPSRGPTDKDRRGPESPEKSPTDRSVRPQKPGSSTWNGSFVHEKPQEAKRSTDQGKKSPGKSVVTHPVEKEDQKPRKPRERNRSPSRTTVLKDSTLTKDITDITDITDNTTSVTDDTVIASEIVQHSSYVIDHSSSFTTVTDIKEVIDEIVVNDVTESFVRDIKDVIESSTRERSIDEKKVTRSMVASDVVDETGYEKIKGPGIPEESPRRTTSSPDGPGSPRGIPGLREDDKPKSLPAAGKPSRPRQPDETTVRPGEIQKPRKSPEPRPKSPEKPRDYPAPKSVPAAGKPSRKPDEKPDVPSRGSKIDEKKPIKSTHPDEKPETNGKRPAAGKPSRSPERPEKYRVQPENKKTKPGDDTPDSLEGEEAPNDKVPTPRDILKKIPMKEQCICELCTCGRHRCPHNLPEDHLEIPHDEPVLSVTSYRDEYDVKHVDRSVAYRHEDHLHMEGDFVGERRTDYVATRGERAPVKRPRDNLKPEGDMDGLTTTELVFTGKPGERPSPVRRNTYTKVEGDFTDETTSRMEFIDHRTVQRAEIIRRTDNLTVGEGEFTGTSHTKDDFHVHDIVEREPHRRPTEVDQVDRFYERTDLVENVTTSHEEYRNFDQTDYTSTLVVRRDDQLKLEGPFEGRPKDDYKPITEDERLDVKRQPIKHTDNLMPEGDFTRPVREPYAPGERAPIVRHPDNLFPEGEFPDRKREPFKPAERRTPIKPEDTLRSEGDFERPPHKAPFGPTERRSPIKHPDNLTSEGDFERPEREKFRPAERPVVKKPKDNLMPEGDFERPHKSPVGPGERRSPIKHSDNLKPEGDFVRPEHEAFRPAERPVVKKPIDNLKPEGDFDRPHKSPVGPGERRTPIKHSDNLKPEGDFVRPEHQEFRPAERPVVNKPKDNLMPEGDFTRPVREPYAPGERAPIVHHPDNLFPEGEFPDRERKPFKPAERRTPIKPEDTLRPEGDFERPPHKAPIGPAERRSPIKHPDNLTSEGDFERPEREKFRPAERPVVKKPIDNLMPEGEFDRPHKSPVGPGERRSPIKHSDNLRPEGDFVRPEHQEFRPAERPVVKKPKDNLMPEGDFDRPHESPVGPGERRSPIKHSDNLRPEGDFVRPEHHEFRPAERPVVKKPKDNLMPEGEFDRPHKSPVGPGERRSPIKHSDNLRPEGDFVRPEHQEFRPAERPVVKKPVDNLMPEGDFDRPQKSPVGPGERRSPIKHSDNLRPEGDFVRPEHEKFRPAERPVVKKPIDNLKPEGDFDRPHKSPVGPGERRSPIKHSDNLRPEGEFIRPEHQEFRPAERPVVKKPVDNLMPEGDFDRPQKSPVGPGERRSPIKHSDNLRPEGEFVRPEHQEFRPAERPVVKKPVDNLMPEGDFDRPHKSPVGPGERRSPIKHSDNLRPEGDFVRPEHQEFRPAERPVVKKPVDNLMPEGDFDRPQKSPVGPGERRSPIKHSDNLRPEGDFVRPEHEKFRPAERPVVKKPIDNLKPEGDFDRPHKSPVGPGERRSPIKHSDNLRPEGEFVRPEHQEFRPAERPVVKKPVDNLMPEGDFDRPHKSLVGPGERRSPIKHSDNLRPEGDFVRPEHQEFRPAERPVVKKPIDNLMPEGDFDRPQKTPVGPGERRSPIKHLDNLRPEGDFDRPHKSPVGPGERRSPIKHSDNLKPEGDFVRPEHKEFRPAERPVVKKPKDNLVPEGDFDRPRKSPVGPGERRSPIKHSDNLRPEGDFVRPEHKEFRPAERPVVKKPVDNLMPEGDFDRPHKSPVGPGERRSPIKHSDNLRPEGDFVRPEHEEFRPAERPVVKKPIDNLKPEGDFDRPHKSPVGPGERRSPIKHSDNLRPEGDFVRPGHKEFRPAERPVVKKPVDNLMPEGDFDRPHKSPVGPGERRSPIKHSDNLKPEGDFVRPEHQEFRPAERPVVKKPKDNLIPEGDFDRPRKSPVGPAERRSTIKHSDTLKMEGEIDMHSRSRDDYTTTKRIERAEAVRHVDNLKIEGEYMDIGRRDDYNVTRGERAEIIRHEDNIHIEGDFERRSPAKFVPAERRTPIRHEDNLYPEGDMQVSLTSRDDYTGKQMTSADRRVVTKRREDNLRVEGEIDVRRSRDDFKRSTIIERVDVRKREDNLRIEGEFVDFNRRNDYSHFVGGDKSPAVQRHPDNLHPEGDFERPRKQQTVGPGERRTPIRHPDNLKPEGDFESRRVQPYGPAERRTPIRQVDNLKSEGEFVGRSRDDYTTKRAERTEIVRREDNLRVSSRTMDTRTTSNDSFGCTSRKAEQVTPAAGKTISHRRHMESSFSLGDQSAAVTTTNQSTNYNTYTRKTGKDVASSVNNIVESDINAGKNVTSGTKTITDGRVVSATSRAVTSSTSQRATSTEQHLRSQNITNIRNVISEREDVSCSNGQQVNREDRSSSRHSDNRYNSHEDIQRHRSESSKRDYVNTQRTETGCRQSSANTTSRHTAQQHTIASQARYATNNGQSSSPEFRQAIGGTNDRTYVVDSTTKSTHHRKNVISSSSADVNNSVLHRRGNVTSTEALHTISSTAADQRKSISNLAESGQYISNSSQSNDRRSLTSLHHRGNKDGNPWASSTYEQRPQRVIRQDNLTVGGKFYSHSEAKNYGNFTSQKVERVQKQSNVSHISLGDGGTTSSSSMYKREFVPRVKGPCPAALLEAKQAPFKHTRDTHKHKFYLPVVSN